MQSICEVSGMNDRYEKAISTILTWHLQPIQLLNTIICA